MRVTLLGSGDAGGTPAPFCDCKHCSSGPKRRRPGLLVESGGTTLLLDASPDIGEAALEVGVTDPDAVFLTHCHADHVDGVFDLALATDSLDPTLHLTETADERLDAERGYLAGTFDRRHLDHGEAVEVGDLRVVPFPVAHGRPEFDTLGFAVDDGDRRVVYAPDAGRLLPDREGWEAVAGAELLFVEGTPLYWDRDEPTDGLRRSIERADADRTVLVHLSEHVLGMTTAEIEAAAERDGYEAGRDLATYEL